jgi:hypothetical protein
MNPVIMNLGIRSVDVSITFNALMIRPGFQHGVGWNELGQNYFLSRGSTFKLCEVSCEFIFRAVSYVCDDAHRGPCTYITSIESWIPYSHLFGFIQDNSSSQRFWEASLLSILSLMTLVEVTKNLILYDSWSSCIPMLLIRVILCV